MSFSPAVFLLNGWRGQLGQQSRDFNLQPNEIFSNFDERKQYFPTNQLASAVTTTAQSTTSAAPESSCIFKNSSIPPQRCPPKHIQNSIISQPASFRYQNDESYSFPAPRSPPTCSLLCSHHPLQAGALPLTCPTIRNTLPLCRHSLQSNRNISPPRSQPQLFAVSPACIAPLFNGTKPNISLSTTIPRPPAINPLFTS